MAIDPKIKTRRVRYCVAMSLDGFIAGPNREYDWITIDPSIDFGAFFEEFDTALMGRKFYDVAQKNFGGSMPGIETIVCSRTLRKDNDSNIRITVDAVETVAELKSKPGKDIWLFGGGAVFRSLLDARLVDTVETSIIPVILSDGIPLLPPGKRSPLLQLIEAKSLSNGTVSASYNIQYLAAENE